MQNTCILSYIIILLSSFSVGMILALIIRPKQYYHGPNAKKFCKRIYYDKKNNRCIKFGIIIIK